MAKAPEQYQGLNGKVGNLIFYTINGVTYVRSAPAKKDKSEKKPSTPAQLHQQEKLRLTRWFLEPLRQLVYFTHQHGIRGARTGYHEASGQIMNHALVHHDTGLALAPNQILISSGNLTGPKAPQVGWTEDGRVKFTWENNVGAGNAKAKDQVLVLLYDLEESMPYYLVEGPPRSAESLLMDVPIPEERRGKLHAYIAFSCRNSRSKSSLITHNLSNSVYLGTV
ncbi:hypothetical protein KIH41_06390 [Litoribacter ruber]|uniref:DUF6266 family protein n=1 Tax=Litoribacter ruber TaxID=702568 RepID=UPI001BDAF63F|nr:DUF6266 family protein [Litoribacter ruber]MBT0810907.1 hypothetical protein [Litoribacter ruber]